MEPRLFPTFHTAIQNHGIRKSQSQIFHCPTGSACFLLSGSVKDNRLLPGQGGQPGFEVLKRNGAPQVRLPELFRVLVRTDEKCLSGHYLFVRLFR
jgi:hypothetical protein